MVSSARNVSHTLKRYVSRMNEEIRFIGPPRESWLLRRREKDAGARQCDNFEIRGGLQPLPVSQDSFEIQSVDRDCASPIDVPYVRASRFLLSSLSHLRQVSSSPSLISPSPSSLSFGGCLHLHLHLRFGSWPFAFVFQRGSERINPLPVDTRDIHGTANIKPRSFL